MNSLIQPLTQNDLGQVLQLVEEDNIWSDITWQVALNSDNVFGIFDADSKEKEILGCIVINRIDDVLEIEQVFVASNMRRLGLAEKMLEFIVKKGLAFSCNQIWLEVRRSNLAAITLYTKLGFLQTGVRKNYYNAKDCTNLAREDALLLSLALS